MSAVSGVDARSRACFACQPAVRSPRIQCWRIAAFLSAPQPTVSVGSLRLSRLSWSSKRTSVAAHGILDAYRKDKGLLERQKDAFRQSNEGTSPNVSDEDEETCPAECVREIREGELSSSPLYCTSWSSVPCLGASHHTTAMLALCQASWCVELRLRCLQLRNLTKS